MQQKKLLRRLNNVSLSFHGPKQRGGYTISNVAEIWAAAKDRKEMVLMWWWKPDILPFEVKLNKIDFSKIKPKLSLFFFE